ncbi:hypothetical protein [Winogradskyella sp.]|uniref:hypothetical protein n=1 Tax=Winogradskyella sp. TaxID=1883156 RepID=UPI00260ECA13|nr:hypothetical protein [Winogradskyella sp.]
MNSALVNIIAYLNTDDTKNINRTLELRYLLADTIEHRKLGIVINEGTGKGFVDISFTTTKNYKKKELEGILLALGFINYQIEESYDF